MALGRFHPPLNQNSRHRNQKVKIHSRKGNISRRVGTIFRLQSNRHSHPTHLIFPRNNLSCLETFLSKGNGTRGDDRSSNDFGVSSAAL
jgi:hypothetical protein